jgi:CHAD domain-containing protein
MASARRKYRLKDGEPVPKGVARMARGRIDDAVDELNGATDSTQEEAVHEARKNFKKLRALVRLTRDELGSEVYRRENQTFREAGQQLSGVRDADVMLATLADLEQRYPDELGPADTGPAADLRQALEAHRIRTSGGARTQLSEEAVRFLRRARRRIGSWPLEHDGFRAVEGGLRRSYRRGRRGYRAALREPGAENLHEWRKRVKDLWYHLDILRDTWKPVMKALAKETHELSDRLGDDHDLAVLLAWAEEHDASAAQSLRTPVERRRAELQADAFTIGARLYADKPGRFVQRVERWWDASAGAGRGPGPATTPH